MFPTSLEVNQWFHNWDSCAVQRAKERLLPTAECAPLRSLWGWEWGGPAGEGLQLGGSSTGSSFHLPWGSSWSKTLSSDEP